MRLETVELDLPPLVAAFGRRLHEAGVPVTPERSARFAERADARRGRSSRTRLYWTARAVLVSDAAQVQGVRRGVLRRSSAGVGAQTTRDARATTRATSRRAPDDAHRRRGRRADGGRGAARAGGARRRRRGGDGRRRATVARPGRGERRGAAARASASTRSSRASSRSSTG